MSTDLSSLMERKMTNKELQQTSKILKVIVETIGEGNENPVMDGTDNLLYNMTEIKKLLGES